LALFSRDLPPDISKNHNLSLRSFRSISILIFLNVVYEGLDLLHGPQFRIEAQAATRRTQECAFNIH
jgi:hypothetical protein